MTLKTPSRPMVAAFALLLVGVLAMGTARAAAPAVRLSASTVDFGSVQGGNTSAAKRVTLRNVGTAPLAIQTVSILGLNVGDFFKSGDTCSFRSLAPSAACTMDAKFRPSFVGIRKARFSIPSNAPGSPHAVALVGRGIDTVPPFAEENSDFKKPHGQLLSDTSVRQKNQPMSGTATDNWSGIASVTLFYDGTGRDWTFTATLECDDSTRLSCTWQAPVPQETGWYAVMVLPRDRGGTVPANGHWFTVIVV